MANTFSGTSINDTLVMSSCLSALKLALQPLKVFTLDVGSEPTRKGASVVVPLVTAGTATIDASDYESGDSTVTGYPVTITQNISSQKHISAIESSKTSTDLFEKQMMEATYEVAYKCLLNMYDLATAASFSSEGIITAANFDADALLDVRNICITTLKMRPNDQLNLVLDTAYYTNLLKDPAIKDQSASGLTAGVDGFVRRFAGVNIYESGILAACANYGGSEDLRGFMCLPRCMAATIRPPAVLSGASNVYDVVENVSDPETGLTLQYRRWVSPKSNTLWGAVEVLWGGAKVDGGAMRRIIAE